MMAKWQDCSMPGWLDEWMARWQAVDCLMVVWSVQCSVGGTVLLSKCLMAV